MKRYFTLWRVCGFSVFYILFMGSTILVYGGDFLFDASKEEVSGNADWIIDADTWDVYLEHYPCSEFANEANAQHVPTPDQATITDETDWTGGISAWGFDLVQAGHLVRTLPHGEIISYGDGGNPYDLMYYDVFIIPEPQQPFSSAEITAILSFVTDGGGLFLVADHQTSDRNCSGWDSPHIFNDLMGVVISSGTISDYGVFGLVFNVQEISGLTNADYWFTEAVDDNVSTDPLDPIIQGIFGDGSGGLGFFGATSMTIDPPTNPTVTGHVWKTDAGGQGITRVTFVTVEYGSGRVAAIGDSSPADDGTGDPGDTLYDGWDKASGGVANDIIYLNACDWLLSGGDTTPPVISSGPSERVFDCTTIISWETNELASTSVEYGPTTAYGNIETVSGYRSSHSVTITGLTQSSLYHYRVYSSDRAGNGPTYSSDQNFTTTADQPPQITSGPTVQDITGSSARIAWSTDEPSDSVVDYGLDASYGDQVLDAGQAVTHEILLTGLIPETTYHYRVSSTDHCPNGPTQSGDGTFTTAEAAQDISSWTIYQFSSAAQYTFPSDTLLSAGGYAIVARNCDLTAFQTFWGVILSPDVLFFNSNADGSCLGTAGCLPLINGGESYTVVDEVAAVIDGETISGSSDLSYQRTAADAPPGNTGSWNVLVPAQATPGSGMIANTGAGVVLSEWTDALGGGNYIYEFVELFNDGGSSVPDTIAPDPVDDLTTEPVSANTIQVSFTAVGDDGTVGSATVYDLRYAPNPISSESDFATATTVDGEPTPQVAGSSEAIDVTGLLADTTYFFIVKVGDEVPNWSSLSNTSGTTTSAQGQAAEHVVISEIQTRGTADHNDEFIELYNPTSTAVNLSGWSIQYKSATGTTFVVFSLPAQSIPSSSYFLLARSAYTGSTTPEALYANFALGASGGNVFLVNTTTSLPSCTAASVVDRVGYGSGNCPEPSTPFAAPSHGAGESIERAPGELTPGCGNGTDTDTNSADFAVRTPSEPQNSSMTEAPCGSGPGNVGNTLLIESTTLNWGVAFNAMDYKIRRSTVVTFMIDYPIPEDYYLLDQVTSTGYLDPDVPPVDQVFYYFINATDGSSESQY